LSPPNIFNTWVAAVGDDGYVATVTPAEALAGGKPLLISLIENGTALAEPRLVVDGDVKGGRYVSGVYDLVVGQGVLERPGEHDADLALGRVPLRDFLLHHARRRTDSNVSACFLPVEGRQAGKIPLDERFDRREVEAADKDEREVAGIAETLLVEAQRLIEIHLSDQLRAQRRAQDRQAPPPPGRRTRKPPRTPTR